MKNFSEHPIQIAYRIREKYDKLVAFEFSRYSYIPQSILDNRTVFALPAQQLSDEWLRLGSISRSMSKESQDLLNPCV